MKETKEKQLSPESDAVEAKSSRKMVIFGGAVMLFAVIGIVATIWFLSRTLMGVIGNDREKESFEWMITPVVLQDPPTFDDPGELIDSTIITAGVWRLIMNEDTSKYPADQMNFITVPQSDIEVQIKAIFGDVKYTHQSVGDTELLIAYDEENKSYIFPAVPHVLAYTPEVQEIEEQGEFTVLTVGYIPPGPVWEGDVNGKKYRPSAEKIMTYTLYRSEKGEWRLYSVKGTVGGGSDFHPGDSSFDLGEVDGADAPPMDESSTAEESVIPEESGIPEESVISEESSLPEESAAE